MKQVRRKVLVAHSAHAMYGLVTDVESYPQFLPWCARAEVLSRDGNGLVARLHLAYAGLRHAFTTRNTHEADRRVTIALVDGPFSTLDGDWRFTPVVAPGAAPGAPEAGCRIEFELRYAFANVLLEAAISPVFDRIANTFVDSFVRRADAAAAAGA